MADKVLLLKELVELMRTNGVTKLVVGDIMLEMKASAQPLQLAEIIKEEPENLLTDDELLFWSAE